MQTDRAGGETDQDRNIQVLIFFGFDNVTGAGFADFEIGAVGVEHEFRLDEYRSTDTCPHTELGTELDIVDAKVKSVFAVADGDVVRAVRQGLETALNTESELRLGRSGAEEQDKYYQKVFHACSDFMVEKTAAAGASYIRGLNEPRFNHTLKMVLKKSE